jgi:hypothetical protein
LHGRNDRRVVFLIDLDHLPESGFFGIHDVVGQDGRKRLVADKILALIDSMAEA